MSNWINLFPALFTDFFGATRPVRLRILTTLEAVTDVLRTLEELLGETEDSTKD